MTPVGEPNATPVQVRVPSESLLRGLLRGGLAGGFLVASMTSFAFATTGGGYFWVHSLWALPHSFWGGLLGIIAVGLLFPAKRGPTRWLQGALLVLLMATIMDTASYVYHWGSDHFASAVPLPFSLFAALGTVVALGLSRRPLAARGCPLPLLCAGVSAGGLSCVLALLLAFGMSDYRRSADCAVVFGARVYRDGTPSLSVSDRVGEGVRLYQQGWVSKIIMTGGVDVDGQSEPRVMARLAIDSGVPGEDIILDEKGNNTALSARSCAELCRRHGLDSALLVSHYYHLARCHLAFGRAGVVSHTVPARMTRRLAREPYFVLRESAAFVYYALFH